MNTKSISFFTLGCRLNQSETAVIERTFEHDGYRIVDFNQPADVVVINTCTVTENGDADTRRLVNKINRTNPNARIALVGCQAQVQKEKLAELPNVRWVVGNARKMDLLSIIREFENPSEPQVITPTIPRESFTIATAAIDRDHTRANIKIQDGCDFFCSFCEIPYARGRARSREFNDIIKEVSTLAKAGYKEVVITGINVGTYQNAGKSLLDVIDALEQISGLERTRISSIEPTTIPFDLIKRMAGKTKLCRYLHIPLQSADDQTLGGMKRKYSYQEFKEFVQNAHETIEHICIGTDMIAGFPGETDEHFSISEERLREELPIDYIHVFSYSQRHMAKSQELGNCVRPYTIQKRSQILRDLSVRKRQMFYQSLLGTTQKVLFEQKKDGAWSGLTDNYARIHVNSDLDLSNQLMAVRLQKATGQGIAGDLQ